MGCGASCPPEPAADKQTIMANVMKRTGAPQDEVVAALVECQWHGGQAITKLEENIKYKQWPRALQVDAAPEEQELHPPPAYWENQDLRSSFDVRCQLADGFDQQIQKLLDGTFLAVETRDRIEDMPTKLQLVHVERIEDAEMWRRYQAAKLQLLRKRADGVQPVASLDGNLEGGQVKTEQLLDESFTDRLDPHVNEFYLWHGTSEEGANGISEDGFKVDLAGHSSGTMFGPGCYFAECSSKSDEYAKRTKDGNYTLLLCRVLCGEMFRTSEPRLWEIKAAIESGNFDTVLGDREVARGTYREFVVFDQDLVYPEYVVTYMRKKNKK